MSAPCVFLDNGAGRRDRKPHDRIPVGIISLRSGSRTMLTTRKLGNQGLNVSSIGLGLMGMSQSYGSPEERDDRESIATIRRAIELGCTFLDTAEIYGPFINEELLARALKDIGVPRDRVVIATKFGFQFENGKITGINSRPEHV